jgi:hypothetical protein
MAGCALMFLANSRISILRGTYQDPDDDTADSNQAIAVDVPASLVQMTQVVSSPETGRSVDIKYIQGFVRPRVDILKGDRVTDQNGVTYSVDSVSQSSLFGVGDKKLTLRIFED